MSLQQLQVTSAVIIALYVAFTNYAQTSKQLIACIEKESAQWRKNK